MACPGVLSGRWRQGLIEVLIYKAFALTGQGGSGIIRRLSFSVPARSGLSLRPLSLPALLFLVLGVLPGLVSAALPRNIPEAAFLVKMAFAQPGKVQVKGKVNGKDVEAVLLLSPGAQIRDIHNRIVLPSHIGGEYIVRMLLDNNGQVHRVWVLTPQEVAASAPTR